MEKFIPSMYDVQKFKTLIQLKLKYGKIFKESDLFQITYYGDDMYRLTYYNKDQSIAKKRTYKLDAIVDKLVEIFNKASDWRLQMCKCKTDSIVKSIKENLEISELCHIDISFPLEGVCIELTPKHGIILSGHIDYGHTDYSHTDYGHHLHIVLYTTLLQNKLELQKMTKIKK